MYIGDDVTYSSLAKDYLVEMPLGIFNMSEENIVDCNISENGNYEITFSLNYILTIRGETYEHPCLVVVEVTQDGYLSSVNGLCLIDNDNSDSIYGDRYLSSIEVKYEYGVLSEEDVQSNIDKYKIQVNNN